VRLRPRRWHDETWICSLVGHVCPAALAARLAPADAALGLDLADGTRMARCLRCDVWLRVDPPPAGTARWDHAPPLGELRLPLRGAALRQRLVLRLIALERAAHVVLFALLAVAALVAELRLSTVRGWAESLAGDLQSAVAETARGGSHRWLTEQLERLADLRPGTLWVVAAAATAYAVVEAFETVGLWRGRRWAEYLTVVVTASLLPFELRELAEGVTAFKVVTLALNLAILAYLVWAKRLFGLRGGATALQDPTDWAAVLASVTTADADARLTDDPGALGEGADRSGRRTGQDVEDGGQLGRA
jgi:uncharacterized membrane protein (DUF2068 family)